MSTPGIDSTALSLAPAPASVLVPSAAAAPQSDGGKGPPAPSDAVQPSSDKTDTAKISAEGEASKTQAAKSESLRSSMHAYQKQLINVQDQISQIEDNARLSQDQKDVQLAQLQAHAVTIVVAIVRTQLASQG